MKTKRKVLLLGEFPPPFGGMAVQAELLLKHLQEDRVSVSAVRRNCAFPRGWGWLDRVKVIRSMARFMLFTMQILKEIPAAGTIYVFSNSYLNFYLYTAVPVIVGNILGKKTVISYHGGAAAEFFQKRSSFLARKILKAADTIAVPSPFLKEYFASIGFGAVVIPNIVDLQRFRFKGNERFSPKFIVTRHLEPEYNIGMIIKAFAVVRKKYFDARLLICGSGSEENKLRELAAALKLEACVEFLGAVENRRMPEIYRRADVYLNGSNVDNLPVAILEAFACGLPVISTRAGGIGFIVEHGKTGLLTALNDHQGMAAHMAMLLEEPAFARQLAENARAALEQYRWENIRPAFVTLLS